MMLLRLLRRGCLLLTWAMALQATPIACLAGGVGAPVLSFIQTDGRSFQWMLWRADSHAAQLFLASPNSPRHIFWPRDASLVYYVLGDAVFRSERKTVPARPERLAALPRNVGEVMLLWLEKGAGRLRIAAMQQIPDRDVLNTAKGLRYRLPDGATIAGADEPAWGLPFVATVLERAPDGKTWKVLARRATKDMAGDTPGLSVVDDLRHEDGVSGMRLLASYTCEAGQCRNDVPADLAEQVNRQAGRQVAADELSIWKPGPRDPAIVFGTVMGDEVHMTPPVLLVSGDRRSVTALPTEGREQVGLAVDGPYLLLAGEWTGKDPLVVDVRSGTVRFSAKGRAAMWVPH